jgi:ABC transport system ATP-binding/permease protein
VNLVSAEGIRQTFAERTVLDGVSVGLDEGDRAGVIGVNGSGKSTLLKILAGVLVPDEGRVVHAGGLRVHYLPQEPDLDPAATPLQAVLDAPAGFDPLEDRADAQRRAAAEAMLDRLGMGGTTQPCGTMSGGQRKRVALARALFAPAELLVLDEPTNHLDVDVIDWLEGQLRAPGRTLLMVTHDRYLLDRIATRIVEVERGRLHGNHGSYHHYLEARAEREAREQAAERKRANLARTELEWLRRGPKARGTKAKHRVESARELIDRREHVERPELTVDLPARRIGSKVVNLHGAGKRYGDTWVLRGADLKLAPGDRIGVVGPNGSGKTTLLGLVASRLEPDEGSVRAGETVHVGWYGQDPAPLPPRTRVIDAVKEVVLETNTVEGLRLSASDLLERFLFTAAQQKAYVSELSGGERRRLELLRVLAEAPNLLLLDEPTNDLDLDTLSVLEAYLDQWPGTLVVSSHDRYFLDRVCDDLYSVEGLDAPGGALRHHPRGWQGYLASRQERAAPSATPSQAPKTAPSPERARKRTYNEQRELRQLENGLRKLEERRATLESELLAYADDYETAGRLGAELAEVTDRIDEAESRWLELSMIGEDDVD